MTRTVSCKFLDGRPCELGHADVKTGRQAGRQIGRQADRQEAGRQIGRQADRQEAGRQTTWKADREPRRQTDPRQLQQQKQLPRFDLCPFTVEATSSPRLSRGCIMRTSRRSLGRASLTCPCLADHLPRLCA